MEKVEGEEDEEIAEDIEGEASRLGSADYEISKTGNEFEYYDDEYGEDVE